MKTNWIKVEDMLPELHYISSDWQLSDIILLYTKVGAICIGYLNRQDCLEWVHHECKFEFDSITHWQPLEAP